MPSMSASARCPMEWFGGEHTPVLAGGTKASYPITGRKDTEEIRRVRQLVLTSRFLYDNLRPFK